MAVALEAIGIAAVGGFGAFSVLNDLFAPRDDQITTVRIYLGQSTKEEAQIDGNVPGVALWDEFGHSIGTTFGTSEVLRQGNFRDIKVTASPDVGNIDPDYIAITNGGTDAMCLAFFTVIFPSGEKSSFSGDVGYTCGAPWYESSKKMGIDGETPKCIWLDRDGSNGLNVQGYGVHLSDFTNQKARGEAYAENPDLMCKSGPRFRAYENLRSEDPILVFQPPLLYNPDGTDRDTSIIVGNPGVLADQDEQALRSACDDRPEDDPKCRDLLPEVGPLSHKAKLLKPRHDITSLFEGKLVVSSIETHSARGLCDSKNSMGPDFASVSERQFCQMSEKKLYSFCDDASQSCCFDPDARQVRPCGPTTYNSGPLATCSPGLNSTRPGFCGRRLKARSALSKSYSTVESWSANGEE